MNSSSYKQNSANVNKDFRSNPANKTLVDILRETAANPAGDSSSQYDNYYGGGGYGSGGAKAKEAFNNLGAISGYNFQTPQLSYELSSEVLDKADEGNKNLTTLAVNNARRKAANDWYKSQQDLQSVTSQLTDASGTAMNGSNFYDMLDLIARRDDQADVEVLNTARSNEDAINQDYWEAMQSNINARNSAAVDAQEAMRNVAADYAAQGNNIDPDMVKDMMDNENHTLKPPDWLQSDDWAKNKFKDPVNPEMADFVRPAMTADTATKEKLVDREPTSVNSGSANKSYWQRMREGYNRRNQ